ncbi:uncharacterized protein [Acropora muricata]|uniref:uncharacterized protein isoform X2 n=1 Tax=Acropora muricata TaxID=159855 RepID=UPI0034E4EFDE
MSTQGSSFPGTSGSQEATEGCASLISSRKLKVTLLSCEWGSTKGGLSTFNRELAIQLAKNDNVEVSMYLPFCSEEDEREAAGSSVHVLNANVIPGFDPIDWLARVPRDHCMDVVIGNGIHLGRQVPVIKELHPNCKWVQVVHTDPEELGIFKDYADPTVKGEKRHQDEVELCKLADQVVAVGPKLTKAFTRYFHSCGKDQDVINFTPGIFSEFANVNQAAEEGETFRVLVFGHGDSEDLCVKGYDIAARAVSMLKDEECSFKLVFVGAPNGKEKKVKKRFREEGISPSQLIVCHAKDREQLVDKFYEADLVIMPSRTEGFGLAELEALSAGLPVLVFGSSGIGKALKKVPSGSNCVVNNEDPVKWAEAIKAVCRKERGVRLEEAALLRRKYAETYHWEGQCSTLVEKMCEMIKETSVAPNQAVNSGEQGSSAILGTVQPHLLDSIVKSRSKNESQDVHHGASGDQQLSLKEYGESYVKLLISTKYLEKERKEVIEEVLAKAVHEYLKLNDHSGDNCAKAMKSFTDHLINVYKSHLVTADLGEPETATPEKKTQNTDIPKRVNHGTLNEGAPLLTSNPLVSALGSHTGLRENQGKRSLNPLETSTPKRKRQNTDLPESETSFVVDKVKKADREISNVVEFLKKEYNRRADFSPLLWSKRMKLQLKEVYTKLRIVAKGEADVLEIDVDDIFGSSEEDNDPLVLVEGSPGIGKTTICLKLAHDWANGAMPRNFPSFKLVFLLKCRDIIKDVVEEIFEQLLPEDCKEKNKEALYNFLEDLNNQKEILIILDGLDELPDESEDRVNEVLGRKKLSSCFVLATTRQEKGIYTREQYQFDICLAIEGFSEESSFEYIRKHFRSFGGKHSSRGERLIKEIKRNPLLCHLQRNPLTLLLLCIVYEDLEGSLPSFITDLYQTIVRCLLRRYCAKEELKASEKDEDLDKQFEIPILALGELAWKCLLNDRLSFYEDELEELERSNENIFPRRLGLIYKEESLRRLKPRHAYSFLQKTFEEYLAASHIAHKFRGSEFQMLEQMLFPLMARWKFKQVFVFVCGILGEEANIVFELIGNMLQKQWDWSKCDKSTAIFFVDSWKETGNAKGMAKTLCSFLPFPRPLHVWSSSQCSVLCDVLKECLELPEELTVAEVQISPYVPSKFVCELMDVLEDMNKPLGGKLTFILFEDVGKGVSKVPYFGLSSVRLRICGSLGSFPLQDVEHLLLHKSLSSLSITVCGDVQESLVEALARGLAGESAVKFLDLCVNGNFSFRGAYLLEQGILGNRSLTNIKVSVNGEPPENWQAVAKSLRAQFSEKAIVSEIYPNTFSKVKDSQLTHLNRFLSKTDLKQQTATLNVWGELSGDGFKALCEVLLHTPVSHLTLNIHGQLTDQILRYIREQGKLSSITINAWVEVTENENKLIKELGLDKNPSFSLNVRGTSASVKESSDSKVVSSDEPQSLIAIFEKATKGPSFEFTEDTSQNSLTIKINELEHGLGKLSAGNTSLKSLTLEIDDYYDDEWRRALGEGLARNTSLESLTIKIVKVSFVNGKWGHGLGEGLAGNTSLKSLTLEIVNYDDKYSVDDDEWGRGLGEELAGNTSLKSLALEIGDSDDEYSDDDNEWARGLGEGLARNTSLESLKIKVEADFTNHEWEYGLGEGLAGNTSLKSLTLEIDDYGDYNDEWGRGLGEGLARNTSLESLTIKIKADSTSSKWEYGLGKGLAGNSSLKSLTLEIDDYGDYNDEWGRGLGEGLARNASLESLTIKIKADFTNHEWEYGLGEGLAGNTSLKSLTLEIDDCGDDNDEWGRGLGEGLARNTSLESLTIKIQADSTSSEWEYGLGEGLAGNTSLKSPTLEFDEYDHGNNEWGRGLCEGLARNTSLESLTLAINCDNDGFHVEWGRVLGEGLAKNNSLNSLTLTINKSSYLTDLWSFSLAEGLARNTSLKSISLTMNNYFYMSSVGAFGLFEGSARNTSLKSVTLTINNYGIMKGERTHDIIEDLARNSSLTSITLAINNYGDMKGEWGHCLFEGLARNTSLNSLTLTANYYGDMSEEGGCVLRKYLRKRGSLTECNLIVDICGKC